MLGHKINNMHSPRIHNKFQKLMSVFAKEAQIVLVDKKVQGNITFDSGILIKKNIFPLRE